MGTTYLSKQLLGLMAREKITQVQFAALSGLSQSTFSQILGRGDRPRAATLKVLCTSLPNPGDGLDILIAHLRDEVDRSGRLQSEVAIDVDGRVLPDTVRILAEEASKDPELRGLLEQMANMCLTRPLPPARMVAEDPAKYPKKQSL
jgi:transcriptional regulator with XRE-family HTH domain